MSESSKQLNKTILRDAGGRSTVHSQRAEAARGRGARPYDARMAAESPAEIDHGAAFYDAQRMATRQLENRCARTAAKTGKFLVSARAIIEPDVAYFLELRQRLNSQGKRGGIEGWQSWCEKHFSCDVRTVNRTLSAILGPEKERKKSRKWRKPAEALITSVEPAIRLARKHPEDPDADEFLSSLSEAEELSGLVPEPQPRSESLIDKMRRYKKVKTEELFKMGIRLAHAVNDGASSVRSDTDDGKRILGLAKNMIAMEGKAEKPQDEMPRSPGSNFVVDEDDPIAAMVAAKSAERQLYHAVHIRPGEEMGKHPCTLCGLPSHGLTTHAVASGMVDCPECLANYEKFGRRDADTAFEESKKQWEERKKV